MAFRVSTRNHSMSSLQQPLAQKLMNDPVTQKTAQSMVTCVYQTHIAGFWRNVTIVWSKNLMNYSLSISVESIDHDQPYMCKIELKPWHFWAKRGQSRAQFRFYVALVSEEEVVLLLGDNKKKAYKRTKGRPALVEAVMFYKKEHVFGKKSFSTRAKFDQKKREHEIVVESSTSGPREPEMWISIDGIVLIHIKNLQWKFRGNQTVLVNKQPVQVFWDVHAWLFCAPGSSHGLFIFKPGEPEADSDVEDETRGDESDCSGPSKYYSTLSYSKASQFCLFLYAWKIE
ncbi:UNVERIFIED_CONTAM: hypothetical protein Sradi_0084400 [Sesamum radiatum]|uniref:DUF868 family protein n=1 Tax=Sesamum radiatum TaxID=300843 RepID=A0AAW2WJC1_SESRA